MWIPDKLESAFQYARLHSPHYSRTLETFGRSGRVTMDEWRNIPFTTKENISKNNLDFLSVTMDQVADFATTSGTTGEPITVFLTRADLLRLARNEKEALSHAGVGKGDIVQLMTTADRQFMAGLAYFLGTQELGAGIIRIGPGTLQLQMDSIFRYKPTFLIAVPSFLVKLIDYAAEHGYNLEDSAVKGVVCIGEAIRSDDLSLNELGRRITDGWNVRLFSTYASTEMATAFTECSAQCGGHLNEDLLYLEVLAEDGNPVASGELGEVVMTTLGVEGFPLIRYRTGDIARLYTEPCSCGRKSARLGPILGRKDQRVKFKGTTLFPNALCEMLDSIDGVGCYKIVVRRDEFGNDSVAVMLDRRIENSPLFADIKEKCRSRIKVVPHFEFHDADYISQSVYKANLRKPEKLLII